MKHQLKRYAIFCLLVSILSGTARATNFEGTGAMPPSPALYPAEVHTSEENGVVRVEKVYYLTAQDDPAAIPTEDFDREGLHYTLLDVLKNDMSEISTRAYTEVVTIKSDTKDMDKIIKKLEPELEVTTEDGYTGILKPDYTNITVEAAGYRTNSWTVSAKRTYPNLSDADVSLLPKSIEDSGRTLTLADVDWQDAGMDSPDGSSFAVRYTAVATYTGTATGRSATGYTVKANYTGEVSKSSVDTVIYTAIFSAENTSHGETHLETGSDGETHGPEQTQHDTQPAIPKTAVIFGILALAAVGGGGWHILHRKKQGGTT